MRTLSKALAVDWPSAFLRTFEDDQGLLVAAFDRQVSLNNPIGVPIGPITQHNQGLLVAAFDRQVSLNNPIGVPIGPITQHNQGLLVAAFDRQVSHVGRGRGYCRAREEEGSAQRRR